MIHVGQYQSKHSKGGSIVMLAFGFHSISKFDFDSDFIPWIVNAKNNPKTLSELRSVELDLLEVIRV